MPVVFLGLSTYTATTSRFALAQAAQAETTALQQQRQVEYLTEQLRQRELDLRAKQLELESEVVGRRLAESQCAKAENSARQDTERAQRALEVTSHDLLSCRSSQKPGDVVVHYPGLQAHSVLHELRRAVPQSETALVKILSCKDLQCTWQGL